jgi:carbamoyl-phosphate synthase small subunit
MGDEGKKARLILEDGTVFQGQAFGGTTKTLGEVVFNTGMVGYPETLTDPSYSGQILVLTYPLIGNYGVPYKKTENQLLQSFESDKIHIRGLIVSGYSENYCHWNAEKSLGQWLEENKIPGIFGIDTRRLTKKLREVGTMPGKIFYDTDENKDVFKGTGNANLVNDVSIKKPITYTKGEKKIILIDCGAKNSIIQAFLKRNFTIKRVPWDYNFLQEKADGVIISNGPGDPKQCQQTIEYIQKSFAKNIPILGVCLGAQLLGLASGADTYKLKYGHRSQNQPCVELGTNRCYITSQNHGYAIDADTLGQDWREWFYNLNDRTNEGIIHMSRPFFGTQFHPESSPGPDDTEFIFDMFSRLIS